MEKKYLYEINKKQWIKYTYMRLLDLYDLLEVCPDDIDINIEVTALEVICKIHEDILSALEKEGVDNE